MGTWWQQETCESLGGMRGQSVSGAPMGAGGAEGCPIHTLCGADSA